MDLTAILEKAFIKNECAGDPKVAYRFSDPDGLRTGKSGYSFGISQFDINNNPKALACLSACGFTSADIARLKAQSGPIYDLNAKLAVSKTIVDEWDRRQISACIAHTLGVALSRGFVFADDTAIIHLADYHNQYHLSVQGPKAKMANYLAGLGRPVTGDDIRRFKLDHTAWGQKRPDDVDRRYRNIITLFSGMSPGTVARQQ